MTQHQWALAFIFIALWLVLFFVLSITGLPSWRVHGVDMGSGEAFYVDLF